MGISMLDSEESSSSVASAIALAVASSSSADENSNEITPNLDAPKFAHSTHQRLLAYRQHNSSLDNTLDNSTDNASFIDPNETLKQNQPRMIMNSSSLNSNSNSNSNSCDNDKGNMLLPQHKKVAILGAGAGIISHSSSSHSSSNSPSAGRSTRSPLAVVSSNNCFRNQAVNLQMPQIIATQQQAQSAANHTHHKQQQHSHSPSSMPSTSQQAALAKQQQLQQQQQLLLKQQHAQLAAPPPRFVSDESFFLFRNNSLRDYGLSDGKDHFNTLSDEIILQIFKWLPKKTLIRCSYVCRRFNRCASDESLWTRLDLGGRALRAGALENVLSRGVVILRLAQAELSHPVFDENFLKSEFNFEAKLQYLDLSMATITKPSLKMLLSKCRQLKKLSLEHVPLSDDICKEIAKNTQLEALNLAMCTGLEAWSIRKLMEALDNLNSLNISWTNMSVEAVTSLVTNVTPNLMRLNMAGCRKTMFDSHLASLCKRCSQLLELDLSDCTGLTGNAIGIICKFKMLEYLSLSRCYLIPASSYVELSNLATLSYLDVFGMLSDNAMEMLEHNFPAIGINKFIHSSVARPTVGTRRTSIWGLRTRD